MKNLFASNCPHVHRTVMNIIINVTFWSMRNTFYTNEFFVEPLIKKNVPSHSETLVCLWLPPCSPQSDEHHHQSYVLIDEEYCLFPWILCRTANKEKCSFPQWNTCLPLAALTFTEQWKHHHQSYVLTDEEHFLFPWIFCRTVNKEKCSFPQWNTCSPLAAPMFTAEWWTLSSRLRFDRWRTFFILMNFL